MLNSSKLSLEQRSSPVNTFWRAMSKLQYSSDSPLVDMRVKNTAVGSSWKFQPNLHHSTKTAVISKIPRTKQQKMIQHCPWGHSHQHQQPLPARFNWESRTPVYITNMASFPKPTEVQLTVAYTVCFGDVTLPSCPPVGPYSCTWGSTAAAMGSRTGMLCQSHLLGNCSSVSVDLIPRKPHKHFD